jgi:hypothetical protein
MKIPSFHDGRFDGFWIAADEAVYLFLTTEGGERLTLVLRGVERLNLSEIREGNIIFDLVFRNARAFDYFRHGGVVPRGYRLNAGR